MPAVVGTEEADHVGDFLRFDVALHGHTNAIQATDLLRIDALSLGMSLDHPLHALTIDVARNNAIDPDIVLP
ncbi:hypothetical protein D3C85_1884210 [compost metagenome]